MPPPYALVLVALVLALGLAGPPPAAAGMLRSEAAAASAELPGQRYWLTLERHEEEIRLRGRVPDALTGTVLTTYAAALFGADAVEADLAQAPDGEAAAPPDWTRSAMAAADTLAKLPRGTAEVTEGAVRITGRVTAPEEAGALTRALRSKLRPGIRVSTEFAVEVPDVVATLRLSPERCAYLMTRIAAQRQILFDSGSAEIEEGSLPGLETIAGLFERCPEAEVEVSGYTDNRGDPEMNLDLSQARAEAVMEVLLDHGVPLRRLRARGFGEADPVASNETEAGRARNRRIEFRAVE